MLGFKIFGRALRNIWEEMLPLGAMSAITFVAIAVAPLLVVAVVLVPLPVELLVLAIPLALPGPPAWMAWFGDTGRAAGSAVGLIWRHPVAELAAKATAPIGACFTFLALLTGSLWGKPMWGTWWVWDARLTSVLILFFLYLGLMALRSSIEDEMRLIESLKLSAAEREDILFNNARRLLSSVER